MYAQPMRIPGTLLHLSRRKGRAVRTAREPQQKKNRRPRPQAHTHKRRRQGAEQQDGKIPIPTAKGSTDSRGGRTPRNPKKQETTEETTDLAPPHAHRQTEKATPKRNNVWRTHLTSCSRKSPVAIRPRSRPPRDNGHRIRNKQ